MNNEEKELRKNIGKKIKLARNKAEYTQEQLAEKTSLSTRYISQLERGIAFGSAKTITSICRTLNISADDTIQNDSPILNDLVDQSFLENYLKLSNYNKLVVNAMTSELVKIQRSSNARNA